MFDEKLNALAIKILMFAPVLYCAFGFWMYNNPQIFKNEEIVFAQYYGEALRSGHTFYRTLMHASKYLHCAPFFVGFCVMSLLTLT